MRLCWGRIDTNNALVFGHGRVYHGPYVLEWRQCESGMYYEIYVWVGLKTKTLINIFVPT